MLIKHMFIKLNSLWFGFIIYIPSVYPSLLYPIIIIPLWNLCKMSNPADKTELQRLIEERDVTLAYLAIYKAA